MSTTNGLDARRDEVLKAFVFGDDRTSPFASVGKSDDARTSNAIQNVDEAERAFGYAGAVEPPYNPGTLTVLLEHSNALRQCVDAYVTNIDAFGHRFEPIIDLDAAGARERVRAYLHSKRLRRAGNAVIDPTKQVPHPSDEEVDAAVLELRERIAEERLRLTHFFDFASIDVSFVTLRRRTRMDLEVLGNGFWEVIRNDCGEIAGFEHVPGFTVRLMPADVRSVCVGLKSKVNDLDYETVEVRRHFRRFVQVFESRTVYFKEFGDPRLVSRKSGRVYPSLEAMRDADPEDGPATEMLHFRIHSPKSVYGVPRWIGTLLSVMGSRQAEEVNYTYFENKSVPPLALLVSGGRVSEETVKRIQDFIENEVKGKRNFHKMLVLEAEPAMMSGGMEHSGRMKVELKPLTAAQHNDALFQNYDERNIDKVGQSFRLPRMLRGDVRDFNRSTAEASLDFAESQVFGPERDEFDFVLNRKILPALGARFHRFKSNGPTTRNPKDMSEMIASLTKENVLTPAEARELAGDVFNKELKHIDADWSKQPVALTLAGIAPQDDQGNPELDIMPGAADAPPATLTAAPSMPTNAVALTGTDLANIVTVNEARAQSGLPPLKLRAGEDDPDGFLTVAEFRAKRTARGEAVGTAQGEAVTVEAKADIGTGDLAASGGLLVPAQDRRVVRQPPRTHAELLSFAKDLLTLRKALLEVERMEAEDSFAEAKANYVEDDEDESAAG